MKNYYPILVLFGLLLLTNIYGQQVSFELTFNGTYLNEPALLDSILIENSTLGCDTTLYFPDSVLLLDYFVGISYLTSNSKESFSISQNYPNPFNDFTKFNILVKKSQEVQIIVTNIQGHHLIELKTTLIPGDHKFTFSSGNERQYIVHVIGANEHRTIKLLSLKTAHKENAKCELNYFSYSNTINQTKSKFNSFDFCPGDHLKYTGYIKANDSLILTNIIFDSPQINKTYLFTFIHACPDSFELVFEEEIYSLIQINNQCWFKENLNVGSMILGDEDQENNNIVEKYCYNDNEINCDTYGALYQWNELMEYDTVEGTQGICPSGWHVPTDLEWYQMANYLDPTVNNPGLQSWQGYNIGFQLTQGGISGFEALFNGNRHWLTSEFAKVDELSFFWTSTINPYNTIHSWYVALEVENSQIYKNGCMKEYGYALRCIKNTLLIIEDNSDGYLD